MSFPRDWTTRLQAQASRKVMLLGISPEGLDMTPGPWCHCQPGVVRVATSLAVVTERYSGLDVPFWPGLVDWSSDDPVTVDQMDHLAVQVNNRVAAGATVSTETGAL